MVNLPTCDLISRTCTNIPTIAGAVDELWNRSRLMFFLTLLRALSCACRSGGPCGYGLLPKDCKTKQQVNWIKRTSNTYAFLVRYGIIYMHIPSPKDCFLRSEIITPTKAATYKKSNSALVRAALPTCLSRFCCHQPFSDKPGSRRCVRSLPIAGATYSFG